MSENDIKPSIRLIGTVTVGPKGQVVIPADVREKMHIEPGDKLVALHVADRQAISFVPESELQAIIDKMGEKIDVLKSVISDK